MLNLSGDHSQLTSEDRSSDLFFWCNAERLVCRDFTRCEAQTLEPALTICEVATTVVP